MALPPTWRVSTGDTITDFTSHAVGTEADEMHFGGGFAEMGEVAGLIAASTQAAQTWSMT